MTHISSEGAVWRRELLSNCGSSHLVSVGEPIAQSGPTLQSFLHSLTNSRVRREVPKYRGIT